MASTKNVIDVIDTIRANSISEEQFKSVWGISLGDHIKKMMEHVRETDARAKEQRGPNKH